MTDEDKDLEGVTGSFFLDPQEDQEEIKDVVKDRIQETGYECDDAELSEKIDRHYQELLEGAEVTDHIPTLTESEVKAEIREEQKES